MPRSLPSMGQVGLLLALFAVALKAVLPVGYMVTVVPDGAMTISVCSPDGPKTGLWDPETGTFTEHPAGSDHAGTTDICPFAVAVTAILHAAPMVGGTVPLRVTLGEPPARAPPLYRSTLLPFAPRAPPVSA